MTEWVSITFPYINTYQHQFFLCVKNIILRSCSMAKEKPKGLSFTETEFKFLPTAGTIFQFLFCFCALLYVQYVSVQHNTVLQMWFLSIVVTGLKKLLEVRVSDHFPPCQKAYGPKILWVQWEYGFGGSQLLLQSMFTIQSLCVHYFCLKPSFTSEIEVYSVRWKEGQAAGWFYSDRTPDSATYLLVLKIG